jgi:hypothetical protein
LFLAEASGMEHAQPMTPAGAFLHKARHELQGLYGWIVLCLVIRDAEFTRAGACEKGPQQDADC